MEKMTDIEDLFSTGEEVLAELTRRWADKKLGEKLEVFLSGDIPRPLSLAPRAVLARQLVSFDHETKEFCRKSRDLGLEPIGCEFLDDKFTIINHGKACLGKMVFTMAWTGMASQLPAASAPSI